MVIYPVIAYYAFAAAERMVSAFAFEPFVFIVENFTVCLIAGKISDREALLNAGFARVECINPPDLPLEEAMHKDVAQHNIRQLFMTNG